MIDTLFEKISLEIQAWIRKQKNIIGHIMKILWSIFLTISVIYPQNVWSMIYFILSWNHYSISFFLEFTFAIYYIGPIIKREARQIRETIKKDELLFCGIPLDTVISHLMTTGTFKRDDIERELWVARGTYYEMVAILDKLGIFIRGENNQRRVDVRLSREDIINRLSPIDEEKDIPSNSREISTDAVQTVNNPFEYREISTGKLIKI